MQILVNGVNGFIGSHAVRVLLAHVHDLRASARSADRVWGPDDPVSGVSSLIARSILDGRLPFGLPGIVPVADVRDVAAVIAAAMRPG